MLSTEAQIINMLTENTGVHMLDSGGAYGRHWERNQQIKDWENKPELLVEVWNSTTEITIDLYHFLTKNLNYSEASEKYNKIYNRFANKPENKDLFWPELTKKFLDKFSSKVKYKYGENTYNRDSTLSQVIQYDVFEAPDYTCYVILQIHNGCDIRGGYTAPVIFEVVDRGMEGYELYCDQNIYCYVEPKIIYDECQQEFWDDMPRDNGLNFYTDDGGYHWYGDNGEVVLDLEQDDDGKITYNGRSVEFYI